MCCTGSCLSGASNEEQQLAARRVERSSEVRSYYTAYDRYLVFLRELYGGSGTVQGTAGDGGVLRSVEAPVWVGCGACGSESCHGTRRFGGPACDVFGLRTEARQLGDVGEGAVGVGSEKVRLALVGVGSMEQCDVSGFDELCGSNGDGKGGRQDTFDVSCHVNEKKEDHVKRSVAGGDAEDVPVVELKVEARGKNYTKNKSRRERAKQEKKDQAAVPEWRRKGSGVHRGVFSSCTSEVQQELRDTRAKMLVERNKTALVRAEVERRKMEANLSSRTYELQVEAERLKLDAAREKVIADKLAKLPAGYAETVASEGLTSCVPSLSDGSVSPNSSISVAEVHKMMKSIADLTVRVAELTAQNQEDYVKKQAVIVQKDEELRAMEKKLAIADMKNRTSFGGEWASSSYDDDY